MATRQVVGERDPRPGAAAMKEARPTEPQLCACGKPLEHPCHRFAHNFAPLKPFEEVSQ